MDSIFLIIVIVFSVVIHEVMHGVAADYLGDKTARYAGRLTLNPIPHLDMFGSILLPALLVLTHSPFLFGYAKPVPYNPYNLRPGRFSEAIVAFAGPASNLVLALVGGALIRTGLFGEQIEIIFLIVLVNTMLFVFNLIPIPPLDGSKVLESLFSGKLQHAYAGWRTRMEAMPLAGMIIVVLFVYVLGGAFGSFIYSVASAIAGV